MRFSRQSPRSRRRQLRRRTAALAALFTVSVVGIAAPAPGATAAHPTYVYDEIVVPGANGSYAKSINVDGDVAVVAEFDDGVSRVYSWNEADGLTAVPDLGGNYMFARGMNSAGQIIGGGLVDTVFPYYHAWIWTPGAGTVALGSLGADGSDASAINDAGVVVGISARSAFRWTAGSGMVDIGIPGHVTYAAAINSAGTIVLQDWDDGKTFARAPNGTLTDIGHLGGGNTRGQAINDAGMIVGSSRTAAGDTHPFAWTPVTEMIDLAATSPVHVDFGQASDVNEAGEVVGRSELSDGREPAFFWSATEGYVIIDGLGTPNRETEADSINEAGHVVGYSYDTSNRERGFVWTLADGIHQLDVRTAYMINDDGAIAGVMRDLDGSNTRAARVREYVAPPDLDADHDGIEDAIEVPGDDGAFDDRATTSGRIEQSHGHVVTVTNAPAPDGVRVVVTGSGTVKAELSVCGFTVKLAPGSDVVLTCGSIIVDVRAGEAEVVAAAGSVVVTVPAGGRVEVDGTGSDARVDNVGSTDVTVVVDGTARTLAAGASLVHPSGDTTPPTVTCAAAPTFVLNQPGAVVSAAVSDTGAGPQHPTAVAAASTAQVGNHSVSITVSDNAGNTTSVSCAYRVVYRFVGFAAPVDNAPTVNSAKAGQTIPVKWQITDYHGVGVASPAGFVAVTTTGGACSPTAAVDVVETYTAGSGLQYLGNGSWQFNWKTPKTYAGLCRTMHLQLADGEPHTAQFAFK